MVNITIEQFNELRNREKMFPLIVSFSGDQTTPINIFYNLDGKHKFLLESAGAGEKQGRFSFLGEDPIGTIKSEGLNIIESTQEKENHTKGKVLDYISEYIKTDYEELGTELPFTGGLVGYIGYDIINQIEDLTSKNPREIDVPETFLLNYKKVIGYDHLKKTISVIYNVYPDDENSYEDILKDIENTYQKLSEPTRVKNIEKISDEKQVKSNFTKDEFERIVQKAKDYIESGDVSQVVVSQRFTVETQSEPFDVYRRLRSLNPSPYLFYIDYEDFQIVGASPESLVSLNGTTVTTNPIAGTRKRGKNKEDDERLAHELLNDPKEKAEHDMLVELGKEDLKKICREETIKLEKYMHLENYSHVMHLVATVTGEINEGLSSMDAFKSCFPAGTVSGSPRKRAMEIIEELENVKREIYSGAIGYFSLNGEMDLCIGIRTIVFKDGFANIQAGAGIVEASVPSLEYKETSNKARSLLEATETAK